MSLRRLTRDKLASFLPSFDLVRWFEELMDAIDSSGGGGSGTVTNTSGPLLVDAVVIGMGGNDIRTLASLGNIGDVLTSAGPGLPPLMAPSPGTVTHSIGPLVNHALTVGTGVSVNDIKSLLAMTDGQIAVGVTGGDPALVSMNGDATMDNTGLVTLAAVPSSNIALIHRIYGGL
jgi:hypothetical protein